MTAVVMTVTPVGPSLGTLCSRDENRAPSVPLARRRKGYGRVKIREDYVRKKIANEFDMTFAGDFLAHSCRNWEIYKATIRTGYLPNIDYLYTATHVALSPVSLRYQLEQRAAEMQRNFVESRPVPDLPARRRRTAESREHPVIETIEQIAERIAGGMIALAPLFWLALLLAFVAVSLGIIPTQ